MRTTRMTISIDLPWPWLPITKNPNLPRGYRNCANGCCEKMIAPGKPYDYCSDCRRDSERRFGEQMPSMRGTRSDLATVAHPSPRRRRHASSTQ